MWKPRLQAAHALSPTVFTICMGELEYDTPFTAILTHDARFAQPWTRVDVDREIVDVTYGDLEDNGDVIPIALSNEGDVYILRRIGTEWKHIPGAGILSEDAVGYGSTYKILSRGSDLIIIGAGRQIYRRTIMGEWETVSAGGATPTGYESEEFTTAAVLGDGTLLIAGIQRPAGQTGDFTEDPRYREDMTATEIVGLILSRNAEASGGSPIARLYLYADAGLSEYAILGDVEVSCIERDPHDRLWIMGSEGLILSGTLAEGFTHVGSRGDRENLLSAAWFCDTLILASDYGLHRLDGNVLSPLKPILSRRINKGVPNPLKVQTVDDVLFYFDYKHGVNRFDGENWEKIVIPPELLEKSLSTFN
jgi:hypothetical protein